MGRLRSSRRLLHFLDEQRRPLYVLDEQGQIIYCNTACAEWCGLEAENLIGAHCRYHAGAAENAVDSAAAGLCPPPEVFSGSSLSASVVCGGENKRRRGARFFWLEEGILAVLDFDDAALENTPFENTNAEPSSSLAQAPGSRELHEALRNFTTNWRRKFHRRGLIGECLAMQRVRWQVEAAAKSRARVVIFGPRGSGREHVARTIHALSGADDSIGPFVPLDCRLIDAEILQSSILALSRRCQESDVSPAGVLALLDIDELSAEAQAELAGFLELSSFDMQIIATAREPFSFRQDDRQGVRLDVQHALSAVVIGLPPLSQRPDDIPLLAQYFLEENNRGQSRQLSGFSDEALDFLAAYPWPENLDELVSAVEHACHNAEDRQVGADNLPEKIHVARRAMAHPPRKVEAIVLDDYLQNVETELVRRALAASKGNKTKAAKLLGVSRARLHRRIEHLGLGNDL